MVDKSVTQPVNEQGEQAHKKDNLIPPLDYPKAEPVTRTAGVKSPSIKSPFILSNELDENFVEAVAMSEPQRAIQNYFDKQYLALFTSDKKVPERLKSILELSTEIRTKIQLLIEQREKEKKVSEQHTKVHTLLQKFKENESFVIGRKYFLKLQEVYAEPFDLMISLITSNPNKHTLLENIVAQKHNKLTGKGLWWLSSATSPITALSRAFLSEKQNKKITRWAPGTLDSQAKALTMELAGEACLVLDKELENIKKEQQKIQSSLAFGHDDLLALLSAESSESLGQIATLNTITKNYDDLLSVLQVRIQSTTNIKTQIQDIFQQRYINIMQADGDEKSKIDQLIASMRYTVKALKVLLNLYITKEELLSKINPLASLMNVFNQHTTNELIGPVVNKTLQHLHAQIGLVNKEINQAAFVLAFDNLEVQVFLTQISLEQLKELINANQVTESIDQKVLSLVTPLITKEDLVVGGKTILQCINERYVALLNHDAHGEERRLHDVLECIDHVDKHIMALVTARADLDAAALKARQVKDILHVLQSNESCMLLINLTKERLDFLVAKEGLAKRKIDTLIHALSAGKAPLKSLLQHENVDVLLDIIKTNQVTKECVEQYSQLRNKIELLYKLRQGSRTLNTYAVEQNNWWVRLTDFLAKLCSIFKTKRGELIDQANALKQQLLLCTSQCEQEITAHINEIKKDKHLGDELLSDLADRHNYTPAPSDANKKPLDVHYTVELLTQMSLFKVKSKSVPSFSLPIEDSLDCDESFECGYGF